MEKYNKKKIITLLIQFSGIALLIYIDYFIKNIIVENIALYEDVDFIKGILGFTYVQNTGMAWSMFSGHPEVLSIITGILLALGTIYMILPIKRHMIFDITVPLIIAGGAANLIDRVSRGFVVDYIKTLFVNFPVYNFADCLITCGAVVLVIYLIYDMIAEDREEKTEKKKIQDE